MREIQWTKDQKKIIEQRDANILVSAAAGSGKTAVLVERIFQRLTDLTKPIDIDQFVVVTFTRAAASQMKDRLMERIEKALEKNPQDRHLQRQMALLPSAHISTVHSFCGYVIRNYFHRIGLDPSYRQGTVSELALIKKEVMGELLEEEYEQQREDFMYLAQLHSYNRSDQKMEERILEIYDKAMSEPFPDQWFERMKDFFNVSTKEEWEASPVVRFVMEQLHLTAKGLNSLAGQLIGECQQPDGPYMYLPMIEEIQQIAEDLEQIRDYERAREYLSRIVFSRLSGKKDDSVSEEKREYVRAKRDMCKKILAKVQSGYFEQSIEENLRDLKCMGDSILTLIRLAKSFKDRFSAEKRERNLVDFHDLEQFALEILLEWDEKSHQYVRSDAARELAEYFEEIMIDEYQDSNRVQDTILNAVSRNGMEDRFSNLFMVGDVKQSIYRFRNACPELFAQKLDIYSATGDKTGIRIDLHQNFRSRPNVLEGTNCVFEKMMHRDLGGVEYDESARLTPGREFIETDQNVAKAIDTYVIMGKLDAEAEAVLTAKKIQEMVGGPNPLMIQDKDEIRGVSYRDIVILTRKTKGVGQTYYNVLAQAGIPVVMDHTQGFFETREIQIMTQMFQIIDNPREDIPLAGVLCSPLFGWTEDELAQVRANHRGEDLYKTLCDYEGEVLREKKDYFLSVLERLRKKTEYAPVYELIRDIYDETGIYDSVRMMKDGRQRTANMDGLMEQAREFDASTYHGLHAFVQYIRRIKEQKEEMGEVNTVGEEEDVVRIMTIHKSKGLEFPVCFLLGMGNPLRSDDTSYLTIQPELGIASVIEDSQTRTKKENLFHSVLKQQNKLANLGEELRILYVAMTRAQEKLILVGCAKEVEGGSSDYLGRSRIKTYLDMVLPAALTENEWFCVTPVEREELILQEMSDQIQDRIETEILYNYDTSVVYHESLHRELEESDRDKSEPKEPLPVKLSVSELKIKSMEEQDWEDFSILSHEQEDLEMPVPDFIRAKEELPQRRGAAYGTIWHQVMAAIDFEKTSTKEEIEEAVEDLIRSGRLRENERAVLNIGKLKAFFDSSLGRAMREAKIRGTLKREQPFVISKPACEIYPDRTESDEILIQGIMDAYFESEDGLVLMDYKTDSIKEGQEEILIDRYRTQMELYCEALENIMGKPVSSCVLYSFSLGKEITMTRKSG